MKNLLTLFNTIGTKAQNLALLLLRLVLAYGFYEPALNKWKYFNSTAEWFASMNYPLPKVSVFLSVMTESLGVILLILGLGVRLISVPMIFVMAVATFTVHIQNGFAAGDNGFEIPLYYALMLFTLFAFGGGKISIDSLWTKRK